MANQPVGQPVSQSVSQSVHQSANQSVKQSPTTTIIQSHAPRNATSLYVSLTPTRTAYHSAGNPPNPTQLIMSLRIHSLTQHVTRALNSQPGLLFLMLVMPLPLTWLHPLMLLSHSVRCALRYHTSFPKYLARSHAHAKHLLSC